VILRSQIGGFWLAALGLLAALALPLSSEPVAPLTGRPGLLAAVIAAACMFTLAPRWPVPSAAFGGLGVALGCFVTLILLNDTGIAGDAAWGFWLLTLATWLGAILTLARLAALRTADQSMHWLQDLAIPLLFGAFLIYLWEVAVRGFGVSPVLMPAPSATARRLVEALPILREDFVQTFMRSVLAGYAIGCGAGFFVAVIAHRFDFLKRGLLPLGNFVSALPIVGIAPIMVMWFGFDWPSKAAVVAVMCFFPMLVNTLAGLAVAGPIERDLMRSYGAQPGQTLLKLHLLAAMPFIFNALKINTTLAMIGAIVAEFFGTPIVGMGFRISTEVGHLSIDMVWATIVVAALTGSLFYALVAGVERRVTFWHASYRAKEA